MKRKNVILAAAAVLVTTSLWISDATRLSMAAVGPGGVAVTDLGPTTGPAAAGRKVWLKYNCAGCHGAHDEGGMAPSIRHEADDIAEAVVKGKGEGMPAYKNLITKADINNLKAYLRSVCNPDPLCTGEPRFTHWWESTPTQ